MLASYYKIVANRKFSWLRIKSCEKLKTKSFDDFGKNVDIY
jgi:hypothetical protein